LAGASSGAAWAATARRVEADGYATLFMPDHFDDQWAPVPAMAAAAAATTTLRIASLVLDNDYRHPVVLAKEAATLDVLSDGRLELGLGAGWQRRDYDQSGIAFDDATTRVDRLAEALAVIKGLLGDGRYSFTGRHYIVGVNFDLRTGAIGPEIGPSGTEAATAAKVKWVRDAAGSRFDQLELSVRVYLAVVTDQREQVAAGIATGFGLTPEEALGTPHFLVGSIDQIVDDLVRRREELGLSYVVFSGGALDDMAPVVARLAGT